VSVLASGIALALVVGVIGLGLVWIARTEQENMEISPPESDQQQLLNSQALLSEPR
jgi:hypothetical protein